jgi:hypothetical protein
MVWGWFRPSANCKLNVLFRHVLFFSSTKNVTKVLPKDCLLANKDDPTQVLLYNHILPRSISKYLTPNSSSLN